jgi:uncharacterized membrane protein YcaP (DUF421 family)
MQPNPGAIVPFDLERIFIGDMPWLFMAEVLFRTVVIYLFALALIRLVSQRAVGQLSIVEFLLVIALGSAVGDAMFYPDVPLLHAFAVITTVVLLDRAVDWLILHSEKVERLIQGEPRQLIADGVIDLEALADSSLDQEMLFELLREREISHLGEVRAAFLEQRGSLTLARTGAAGRPGLPVMPPYDLKRHTIYGTDSSTPRGFYGCHRCGTVILQENEHARLGACPNCVHDRWVAIQPANGAGIRVV